MHKKSDLILAILCVQARSSFQLTIGQLKAIKRIIFNIYWKHTKNTKYIFNIQDRLNCEEQSDLG